MAGLSRLKTAMDNTDEHFRKLDESPELDDELGEALDQALSEDHAAETLNKRRERTREILEEAFPQDTMLMESEIGRDQEPPLPKITLKSVAVSPKPKDEPIINRRWIDPRIIENTKQGQESNVVGEIVTGNGAVADTRDATAVAASVITSGDYAGMTKDQAIAMELAANDENPLQVLTRLREATQNNIKVFENNRAKIVARMKVEVSAINAEHKAIEDKKTAEIAELRARISQLEGEITDNAKVRDQRIALTDDERDSQLESIDVILDAQRQMAGTISVPVGKGKKARVNKTIEN